MQYDEYGRQTSLSDPDAGTIHYSYNAFGELTGQTDANLNTFEMVYDKAGRLLNKKCTRPDHNTVLTNTWHPANASAGSRGKLQKTEYTDENSDYSGDSAPPFRCKRRHLNWADLFYNINQFFSVFFFRKESPFNSNLCALPDNLSIIASATVFSPIYSYHLLTGICEDINVDRLP